jgi:PKD repeat protein
MFVLLILSAPISGLVDLASTAIANDTGLVTNSPYPVVYVYPNYTSVGVGETFTIAVIGFNFTDTWIGEPGNPTHSVPLGDLYAFDIEFTWDPTVLDYLSHTVTTPVESYPNPIPPSPYAGVLHSPPAPLQARNIVDEDGNIPDALSPETRAWFAYAAFNPAIPQNGNCTFFTMTFQVIAIGTSNLDILKCDLSSGPPEYSPIYRIVKNGLYKTVIAPKADFTFQPQTPVVDELVNFTATVTGNTSRITTYMWNFGDEVEVNITSPTTSHAYAEGNTYSVSLRVLDADGEVSNTVTHEVSVGENQPIEVTGVTTSKSGCQPAPVVGEGYPLRIYATVRNPGTISTSVNVTFYANATLVGVNQTLLAPRENRTLMIEWDTSSFPYGNYTTSTALDGTLYPYVSDWIIVTIPGDVDGNFVVSIFDVVKITSCYGKEQGDPLYNPNADIDGNGAINIFDVVACTGHYGQKWP